MDKDFKLQILQTIKDKYTEKNQLEEWENFRAKFKTMDEDKKNQLFQAAAQKYGIAQQQEDPSFFQSLKEAVQREGEASMLQRGEAAAHGIAGGYTSGLYKQLAGDVTSVAADVGKVTGAIDSGQSKWESAKSLAENVVRANPLFKIPLWGLSKIFGMNREDNETYKEMIGEIDDKADAAQHAAPMSNAAGEIIGFALPGGVFLKSLGWLKKGTKGAKLTRQLIKLFGGGQKGRWAAKTIRNAVEVGGSMGAYSAVENLPDVVDAESIPEFKDNLAKAGEEIALNTAFGGVFSGLTDVGIQVTKSMSKAAVEKLPNLMAKWAGKLSPETVRVFKKHKNEIINAIKNSRNPLRTLGKRLAFQNNLKIDNFIGKHNKTIQRNLANKNVPKMYLEDIVSNLDESFFELEASALGSAEKEAIREAGEIVVDILEKESISGTMLNKLKRKIANFAKFDWSEKLKSADDVVSFYRSLWNELATLENSLGNKSVMEANKALSSLFDYQIALKMKRIKVKRDALGQATKVESGMGRDKLTQRGKQFVKGTETKDEIVGAMQQIDKLTGSKLVPDAYKLNAVYEILKETTPSVSKIAAPLAVGGPLAYFGTEKLGGEGWVGTTLAPVALMSAAYLASRQRGKQFLLKAGKTGGEITDFFAKRAQRSAKFIPKVAEETNLDRKYKNLVKQKASGIIGK